MEKDLHLKLPANLHSFLLAEATVAGKTLEEHCLSLLDRKKPIDPTYYSSLGLEEIRREIRTIVESDLPKNEIKKRISGLEFQMRKRYVRK